MGLNDFRINPSSIVSDLIGGWENSDYPSGLVQSCNKYVRYSISNLPAEGIRLLISQRIGIEFMVPAAICYLQKDPFSGGDYEEGALIRELLKIDVNFWNDSKDLYLIVADLAKKILIEAENQYGNRPIDDYDCDVDFETIKENIEDGMSVFGTSKHSTG